MSHIEKPAKAGGFSSLQSTMKQVLRSQKTRQNIKNLLRVNQTDGFDCPGCAWGDNDHGTFQFCENGAKAVAWESTGKTVGAEFSPPTRCASWPPRATTGSSIRGG